MDVVRQIVQWPQDAPNTIARLSKETLTLLITQHMSMINSKQRSILQIAAKLMCSMNLHAPYYLLHPSVYAERCLMVELTRPWSRDGSRSRPGNSSSTNERPPNRRGAAFPFVHR